MKRQAKARKARRVSVNPLAWESALGRRLRRIEEALHLQESPAELMARLVIVCAEPWPGVPEREGPTYDAAGRVTGGTYCVGPYRQVQLMGPYGVTPKAAEAHHRQVIAALLAEHAEEYAKPGPLPARPHDSRVLRLSLDSGALKIVTGTPEPMTMAERSRSLYPNGRLRNGGPVLRTENN